MAYGGRNPWGRQNIGIYNSQLYRKSRSGPRPEGPWWMKLLATLIAILVVVGLFALIFWIGRI